jgi:hypothetical protein
VELLTLIHKALSRLREKPKDEDLRLLIDTACSIFVFYYKSPYSFVKPQQMEAINKLKEHLKNESNNSRL